MAIAQERFTQNGGIDTVRKLPFAIRASVITPMVFCASSVPYARDAMHAGPTWPQRKPGPVFRPSPGGCG